VKRIFKLLFRALLPRQLAGLNQAKISMLSDCHMATVIHGKRHLMMKLAVAPNFGSSEKVRGGQKKRKTHTHTHTHTHTLHTALGGSQLFHVF